MVGNGKFRQDTPLVCVLGQVIGPQWDYVFIGIGWGS